MVGPVGSEGIMGLRMSFVPQRWKKFEVLEEVPIYGEGTSYLSLL